jgi:hypothetical protein
MRRRSGLPRPTRFAAREIDEPRGQSLNATAWRGASAGEIFGCGMAGECNAGTFRANSAGSIVAGTGQNGNMRCNQPVWNQAILVAPGRKAGMSNGGEWFIAHCQKCRLFWRVYFDSGAGIWVLWAQGTWSGSKIG